MKRERALVLFEAWERKHLRITVSEQAAFLSGIAAGLRESVEIVGRRSSTRFFHRNEEIMDSGVVVRALGDDLKASLKELEAGT